MTWLPSDISDDFTGNDGDALNTLLWGVPYTRFSTTNYGAKIVGNAGRIYLTGVAASGGDTSTVDSLFTISGDFDIQIDFLNLVHLNHVAAGFSLAANLGSGDSFFIKAHYYSGNKFFIRFVAGGTSYDTEPTRTNAYGKFRLSRVGSICSVQYIDGSGSTWSTAVTHSLDTTDATITLEYYDYNSGSEVRCDFDNFTVNSADSIIVPSNQIMLHSSGGVILDGTSLYDIIRDITLNSSGGLILSGNSILEADWIRFVLDNVKITQQDSIYSVTQKVSKFIATLL